MSDKQTVKFGDICREVKLTTKDPIGDGYERYIGLEHLDSGSLKIKRWGMIAEDNPSFTRVFKKGHILFGKRRPYLKKAAIAEFDGICSGDIIVMESEINSPYVDLLPYIVQSDVMWEWAIKTSSGSLSPRTKFKELVTLPLSLPLEKDMAKKLEVLSKIDSLLNETRDTALTCMTTANLLFERMYLSGKNDWKRVFLGDCLIGRPTYGATERGHEYSEGYVRYIRVTDINDDGTLSSDDPKWVPKSVFEKNAVDEDDFLFARSGNTVGKTLLYRKNMGDAAYAGYLIKVVLNANILLPEFLDVFTKSNIYWQWLRSSARGGAQPNINAKQIEKMPILLPPIDKQILLVKLFHEFTNVRHSLNEKHISQRLIMGQLCNWRVS